MLNLIVTLVVTVFYIVVLYQAREHTTVFYLILASYPLLIGYRVYVEYQNRWIGNAARNKYLPALAESYGTLVSVESDGMHDFAMTFQRNGTVYNAERSNRNGAHFEVRFPMPVFDERHFVRHDSMVLGRFCHDCVPVPIPKLAPVFVAFSNRPEKFAEILKEPTIVSALLDFEHTWTANFGIETTDGDFLLRWHKGAKETRPDLGEVCFDLRRVCDLAIEFHDRLAG